jgi:hypothetical protein
MSLRHWAVVGQHGIWGGLVEAERDALRREWLNGVPVTALLSWKIPGKSQRHYVGRLSRVYYLVFTENAAETLSCP